MKSLKNKTPNCDVEVQKPITELYVKDWESETHQEHAEWMSGKKGFNLDRAIENLKKRRPDLAHLFKGESKEVATVGVTHNGKLLMGKRNDNGKWTTPGGHLDPGEKPIDGARRELLEEAGLKIDNLKKIASKLVTTPTGKKMKIHAFTVDLDKKPKTTSKNDPDEEVKKWEFIAIDPKLPKKVSENLHSPKNVLLDGMGISKGESMFVGGFYIPDLIKTRPHKYLRKYRGRDGKWIYVYHEGDNHGRQIPEEAYNAIHAAAEKGHEGARALRDSMEEHHPEKLDLLRRLADKNAGKASEMARKQLLRLGIDREQERLEEATTPQRGPMEESLGERKAEAEQAVKKALKDGVFGYLEGHRQTPYFQRLQKNGITLDSIMEKIGKHDNVHDMLKELDKQMKRIDDAHAGLPESRNSSARSAGGYGNLGYQRAVEALKNTRDVKNKRSAIIPQGFQHNRGEELDQDKFKEAQEADRESIQREFEAKRREIERERREMAELEGSMAHHMASLMEGRVRNRAQTAKDLDKAIRNLFGKSLRKEDFPYDFSANGLTVKIKEASVGRDSFSISMNVYDQDGNNVVENWRRIWQKNADGGPHIYNDYLVVRSEHRRHNLGSLINKSQQKLMIEHAPNNGSVGVTAALSVGGYNWANQGFSFANPSTLNEFRSSFRQYARSMGVNLTDADMQKFTKPFHFAAFDDGKRYPINTSKNVELTPEQIESRSLDGQGKHPLNADEISSGKTTRMMAHLGKTFMLGRSWRGIWKAKGYQNDIATKFANRYDQLRTKAATEVDTGFSQVVGAVQAGERAAPVAPARSPAPTRGSPTSSSTPSGVSDYVGSYLRRWRPTGRNRSYTINEGRERVMRRWTADQIREFMRYAPMSRTGRARVRRLLIEAQNRGAA